MNEFHFFTIFGSLGAICLTVVVVHNHHVEMETAKVAAAAGLVQQVIKIEGYSPYVVWVKPGEPVKVER